MFGDGRIKSKIVDELFEKTRNLIPESNPPAFEQMLPSGDNLDIPQRTIPDKIILEGGLRQVYKKNDTSGAIYNLVLIGRVCTKKD